MFPYYSGTVPVPHSLERNASSLKAQHNLSTRPISVRKSKDAPWCFQQVVDIVGRLVTLDAVLSVY